MRLQLGMGKELERGAVVEREVVVVEFDGLDGGMVSMNLVSGCTGLAMGLGGMG